MKVVKFKKSPFKGKTAYVYGFSSMHLLVQMTTDIEMSKKFKTEKAAQNWINKYSGAGYGLEKSMVEIV